MPVEQRQAGMFEAPPAMLDAFLRWAIPLYAGHVLALVEDRLKILRGAEGVYTRALEELQDQRDSAAKVIESLAVGESHVFRYYRPNAEGKLFLFQDGVRREIDGIPKSSGESVKLFTRAEGKNQVRFPPHPGVSSSSSVLYYVESHLDNSLRELKARLDRVRSSGEDPGESLVDVVILQQECLKYTDKAKRYTTKAVTRIPVDLQGWKYASGITSDQREALLKDTPAIQAVLFFQPHSTRGGAWVASEALLQVDILNPSPNLVENFRESLKNLHLTARHEFQHVGQSMLGFLKGMETVTGLPSKSLQDPKRDPSGYYRNIQKGPLAERLREQHELREVEFYTVLADEVENFMSFLRWVPQTDYDQVFRIWVGLEKPRRVPGSVALKQSTFFDALHRHQKSKWVKAVGEFLKEVERQGFRTSSSFRVASRHRASYFNVGDVVRFGKYKNKSGKIVAAYLDEKGHPVVEIEPIPKGRKQNKVIQLYRIWHAPLEPKMASQRYSYRDYEIPSPRRVSLRWAHMDASGMFFDNPQMSSVLDFAESEAITNEPGVARNSQRDGLITRKEEHRVQNTPQTPNETMKDPGSKEFSTLSQFLVKTEEPTHQAVPDGYQDLPKAPNMLDLGR